MAKDNDRKTHEAVNRSSGGYTNWRGTLTPDEEPFSPLDNPETCSQGADQGWGA